MPVFLDLQVGWEGGKGMGDRSISCIFVTLVASALTGDMEKSFFL